MQLIKKIIIGASVALASLAANAVVVFENGTNGDFWGGNNPFTYELVTNNFTLVDSAILTSLTYNAFTTSNTVPVTNALVNFYENNDGSLGNLLFSQNLAVTGSSLTGELYGYDLTDFTIALPNLNLGAGDYFLGLQVSPTQWDMHWSIVSTPSLGGELASDGWAHYFRLESNPASVPEPSALLLLGLGIFGLAAARARKA